MRPQFALLVPDLDWKLFSDKVRTFGGAAPWSGDTCAKLNRFRARYELARRFRSIDAEGYSSEILRGYSVGIKLLLAYTAADHLGEAIKNKVSEWSIVDPNLADALRKTLQTTEENSGQFLSQPTLKARFDSFMNSETDDVRIAATVLRVMVAHGAFTPNGTGALRKTGALAVDQLAGVLLAQCADRFNCWLKQMLQGSPNTEGRD